MRAANLIELPTRVVKPRRANRARAVFLTPEETLAVLRTAKDRGVRTWAMLLLAYRHGLRASEVCGLRLTDVDLGHATKWVFCCVLRGARGDFMRLRPAARRRYVECNVAF